MSFIQLVNVYDGSAPGKAMRKFVKFSKQTAADRSFPGVVAFFIAGQASKMQQKMKNVVKNMPFALCKREN